MRSRRRVTGPEFPMACLGGLEDDTQLRGLA